MTNHTAKEKDTQQCWQELLAALQAMIGEASFNTWFTNADLEELKDQRLVVGAANRFVRAWLEKNYTQTIAGAAEPILGYRPTVEIVISREQFRQQHRELSESAHQVAKPTLEIAGTESTLRLPLFQRSNHSFENLLEGRCNRFALAAARQAVDAPGVLSPVYFFGGHGLGKTHLLHAICREASARDPQIRICCLSADYFVQSFTQAYIEKRIVEFRARFERCQLLALDDFQSLLAGKKTASQRELVTILEHFAHHGKQVVLAADRPVGELSGLDPMLASRLAGSVQAKLEDLDEATRLAIVRRNAPELPAEVSDLIGKHAGGGVRELEGILKTVSALARFSGEEISGARVMELLIPSKKDAQRPALEAILAAVSGVFQISASDLRGKKRQAAITGARRVFIQLARQLGEASLSEIGHQLGGRSHSTILNILKTTPADPSALFLEKCAAVLQRLGCRRDCREFFTSQSELF